MSLEPLRATKAIEGRYLDYLKTTFALSDAELQREFIAELKKPGRFVKGPILEATPPFQTGSSLRDLIAEGLLSEEFTKLKADDLPLDRGLYIHQEIAIRKLVADRRNIVVATGTGSGKTETFLLPILNHLFRQQENGELSPGVRALLLYPMNALANDQLKRLRKLLKKYPAITFGSYTGETEPREENARQKFEMANPGEPILPNELLSRERMRQGPPHILLTNYAMMEYLLLRPQDNAFFDGPYAQKWRFIVMDEAHTYSGAKGIEIAMLLRRLKERVIKSRPLAIQCVATSATLGGKEKDFGTVAKFATNLFGEPFIYKEHDPNEQDVIAGVTKRLTVAEESWGRPHPNLYLGWQQLVQNDDPKISSLVDLCQDSNVPAKIIQKAMEKSGGKWRRFIYEVLSGDQRVLTLQTMLEKAPRYLANAAQHLFGEGGERYLVALVYLANKARLAKDDQPLLPARYHVFIRALEGGFCTLAPQKHLFLERKEQVEVDGNKYAVFETAVCRQCSSLYLVGELNESNILKQPGNRFYEDRNRLKYFLVLEDGNILPDNEDEIVASGAEYPAGEICKICARCGVIFPENYVCSPCSCSQEHLVRVVMINSKDGNVHKCPACGRLITIGSVARRFLLGAEAVTSVLGTALYQQLPGKKEKAQDLIADDPWASPARRQYEKDKRRLLVFSDSRQDAAFFATYFANSYNQILQRRLIVKVLGEHKEKAIHNRWRVQDLAQYLKRHLIDSQIYPNLSHQELEDLAWKWVLLEFMAFNRAISLEGLGLLGFIPMRPPLWEPPPALLSAPWNFTKEEAITLMNVLLDTIRRNGAIRYPDNVDPKDEFFAPRNREYFFTNNAPVAGRIYNWLPAGKNAVNTRVNYLMKIPTPTGEMASKQAALSLLEGIWAVLIAGKDDRAAWREHFFSFIDGPNGRVFALHPDKWELRPAIIDKSIKWYCCTKCKRFTLYNIRNVCPTYYCDGELTEVDPNVVLKENHYRKLYTDFLPLGMKTHEHTAQLNTDKASEIQKGFTEGEINVLSCSTTFELGVDVGELEVVFMRNVPPTAANYIQRAGRAGRRSSSTAFALTFAQRRSHDFAHFKEPLRIIKGEIKPPYVEIANEKIIKRHMYAVALAMFWQKHDDYFGNVKKFFPAPHESAIRLLANFLAEKPRQLEESLKRIVPQKMWSKLGLEDWSWVADFLDEKVGVLTRAEAQLMGDLKELKQLEKGYSQEGKHARAGQVRRTINTIEECYIINFLSRRNVIPKYGFPVDVVELQITHHGEEARGLELDRDLKIALSEYAPSSQVVAGGKLWTSRYIKRLPDRDPLVYNYAVCDHCGLYRSELAEKEPDLRVCPCGQRIGRSQGVFITPEFGFIAEKPRRPKMTKPEKTYSTRNYFAREGKVEKELTLSLGKTLILQAGGDGKLAVINSAGNRGFKVCQSCGYAEIFDGKPLPKHSTPWGKPCRGQRYRRYALGYEFSTDILQIWCPELQDIRAGFWESLLYGLIEGACVALDIDRRDIDGTLYPYQGNPYCRVLTLFDDVPGGAGHVKRIAEQDNFMAALKTTLAIVSECECGDPLENTSCYQCLRSYTNQYCHDRLQRGYVKEFLQQLLAAPLLR